MSKRITNINDYTLIEKGEVTNIYFFPNHAITETKLTKKISEPYVLFEIIKEKEDKIYSFHAELYDKDNNIAYSTYTQYLKELDKYKYLVLKNKNNIENAEIIHKETLDFKLLDYDFVDIFNEDEELSKMIPELKRCLEESIESLQKAKKKVSIIDLPSPTNYYQNVIGYLINEIEYQVANDEEPKLSSDILKNVKSNYKAILKDNKQIELSLISTYQSIIDRIKSSSKNILEAKDLKVDTNKTTISEEDLEYILSSFLANLKEEVILKEDLNIIQERIDYILTLRRKVKNITNYIKVILISDEYVDETRRNRSISEENLKKLIASSFKNSTYRPLPRNEVLLYNKTDNIIDFVCIISNDKLLELLNTYSYNKTDNKYYINLLTTISNILVNKQKKQSLETLDIYIITILNMLKYYYNNITTNIALFSKCNLYVDLEPNNGKYNIFIVNKNNNKKVGKLTRISDSFNELVKKSLHKSEKIFNDLISNTVLENICETTKELAIKINIDKILKHETTTITFERVTKKNSFEGAITLGDLLLIISSIKPPKEKIRENIDEIIDEEPVEQLETKEDTITDEEEQYIIRKSHTIVDIMSKKPIDNDNYKKIVELYEKLETSTNEEKNNILLELKNLL